MICRTIQDVTVVSKTSSGVEHALSSQLYRKGILCIQWDLCYGDFSSRCMQKIMSSDFVTMQHKDGQQIV
jgi:hypothetical protein